MSRLVKSSLGGRTNAFFNVYLPKQRNLSPNTIRAYQNSLTQFLEFIAVQKHISLDAIKLEMLTGEMITAFLDHIENERGCGIATRNHRLAAIKAFLTYVAAFDITVATNMDELKAVKNKKSGSAPVEHMSEAAVTAILSQPDVSTLKGIRDRCMMTLMYDLGARVQEILDLKVRDFQFGKYPKASLHGKGDKTRTVPMTERCVEMVKLYLSAYHPTQITYDESLMFYNVVQGVPKPLSDRHARTLVKEYGRRARETCPEVPDDVHPHLFRHSRAMHLYQHGMDLTLISQWLGHVNLETTQIYAYADTEHKRLAIANATPDGDPLHGILNPARYTVSDAETLKRLYGLK